MLLTTLARTSVSQSRSNRSPLGAKYALMQATPIDTTIATVMKARNSTHGDMPAAFITMISLSVESLLSTCATAISSAIGAITSTSNGMIRAVMPMNTTMVWPWLVTRSKSCSACVTQITAVRLTSTTANAPNVVRKIYRPIDPIAPPSPNRKTAIPRTASPPYARRSQRSPTPNSVYFVRPTKWPPKGKAVERAQQKVKAGADLKPLMGGAGGRFWQANTIVEDLPSGLG